MPPKPVQAPQRRVDLDLDVMAPPGSTFRFKGEVYDLPGEIPIPTVIKAVQIQAELADVDDDDNNAATVAFTAMYELVMELVREANPGVTDLPLGMAQIQGLLGLVIGGGATVDQAILASLRNDGGKDKEGKVEQLPPTRPKSTRKRAASRSRKRSHARS